MGAPARRTVPAVAAMALAIILLAGCDQVGPTPGPEGPTGAGEGSGAAPTAPPTVPPGLLECREDPDPKQLQLADVDLATATWSTPSDFEVVTNYHEDNPVETIETTWYAEPTDPRLPTLNVLNVVLYSGLDWGDVADDCGRVPLSAIETRLASYRDQIDAVPLTDAAMTTVAGLPALEQDIGLASYDYHGYWVFSETQLLHVYCQWTEGNRDVIDAGCGPLVDSVRVG
ncbi:hypothetical protein EXU48_18200 [Occultella glacieicola]|uniref:Uncharacterized protein n=1 Tax=Occultella glacieicola TaxID=2518684 RepID=A0ABY2E4Q0_9MICO|nr:hypothetical protein [Occultella glacieicola]TDE90386.1 hypothetical protein EXU48_18200 [Occultella glacieicola]